MIPAIILARGGSKRIPRKNIAQFCGKPLIAWTIRQALAAKSVDRVYVSTDDREIKQVALRYGAEVIDRPSEISGDKSTSEEALKHAVNCINAANRKKISLVVFLQATSPLRQSEDIDNAVRTLKKDKSDSLFSSARIGDFYIWKTIDGRLSSINYDYMSRKRSQDFGEQFVENGSIYVFKSEILFKFNNRLGGRISNSLMDLWKSFEIDEPEDILFCENLFKLKKLNKEQ